MKIYEKSPVGYFIEAENLEGFVQISTCSWPCSTSQILLSFVVKTKAGKY